MRSQAWHIAILVVAGSGCTSQAQVASHYLTTQFISAAQGGTVSVTAAESATLAGTSVTIPPYALAHDATITIAPGPDTIVPMGKTGIGPVADFGPSGTVFDSNVTVTLPYDRAMATNQDHMFVQALESGGTLQRIEHANLQINPSAATVSFPTRGFTQFEVGLDGVCGACPTGSTCDATSNQCVCDTDLSSCTAGGACFDLRTDNNNCGSCGNVCPTGYKCDFGNSGPVEDAGEQCVCGAGSFTICQDLHDAGIACADLSSDPGNCGACGTPCDAHQVCAASSCVCDTGYTTCLGSPSCTSLLADTNNCGTCGHVCDFAGGYTCINGSCTCGAGAFGLCPAVDGGADICSNPITDPDNCGYCGHICVGGVCDNGSCPGGGDAG